MSIKLAIELIINQETKLETKLDLLTNIGITAESPKTFRACEDVRNELYTGCEEMEGWQQELLSHQEAMRLCEEDSGLQEPNEIHGEE